ncbi:hypothetical protein BASA50_003704 [Batrachochytrium salamandrivorans]|uniref:Uncharacterized protein n=1 Tax=Batrachochytrium salamandrivorans TaxID=1357716 RepID=A0ABQ8FI80_9FUNG|nr:hypothetical protein BASA50_003704 [Batrachochytrium salamandrivorans]
MKLTIWIVSIAFTLNVIEAAVIPNRHYANTEQERLYTRSADAHNLMEGDASGLSLGNSDIQSSLTKRWFGRGRSRQNNYQQSAQQNFQHLLSRLLSSNLRNRRDLELLGLESMPS